MTRSMRWPLLVSAVLFTGLAVSACSGGDDSGNNDAGNLNDAGSSDAGGSDAGGPVIGCANPCTTLNATQCSGTEVETCQSGPGGCLAWSSPQLCSTSGQVCSGSACAASTNSVAWTVLIYVAADNTLESDAIFNMNQLATIGSNANVNFIAEVDRGLKYTTDAIGNINWTAEGAKRLKVDSGGNFELISDLGHTNSGDPATLSSFINFGVTHYPAQHYMLVLWDHGGSWEGGFGVDETSGSTLSIGDLKSAITSGLSGTGVSKLDLFGFDACLMASVEVIDALGSFTNYYLGSEEEEPGYGWDYRKFSVIHDSATAGPVELGKAMVDGFVAQNPDATSTLALLDMSQFTVARAAVARAAQAISAALPAEATALAKARNATLEFGKSADPSSSFNIVDFGDLLAQLGKQDASFSSLATSAAAELAASVLYKKGGAAETSAHGLSIYFPPDSSTYRKADYEALSDMTDWKNLLEQYFTGASAVTPPVFASGSHLSVTIGAQNAIDVSAPIDASTAAGITDRTFLYGFSFPESAPGAGDDVVDFYGDLPASLASNTVSYSWDRRVLLLSQGNTLAYDYLSFVQQGSESVANIPLYYLPPGETGCPPSSTPPAVRQLVFDQSGTLIGDTLYAISDGVVSVLRPAQGSHLKPVSLRYAGTQQLTHITNPDTQITWGCNTLVTFDTATTPTVSLAVPNLTGTNIQYALQLQISDAADEGDTRNAVGNY